VSPAGGLHITVPVRRARRLERPPPRRSIQLNREQNRPTRGTTRCQDALPYEHLPGFQTFEGGTRSEISRSTSETAGRMGAGVSMPPQGVCDLKASRYQSRNSNQATLCPMPPGPVINPVAWKWASADHLVVQRSVGMDRKGQCRPDHRSGNPHIRRMINMAVVLASGDFI
jgi:hypothetical protein